MNKTTKIPHQSAGGDAWNDDVLTEILLRLPGTSLVRFKTVCKNWLSIISTHQFACLHTLRHPKPEPSLILRTPISQFFYFHPILHDQKLIPYHFSVPASKILSSCKGLLLLKYDHPQKEYYIYNPTTKQSRKISLNDNDKYTDILGLNLAFDPSKSLHYKIVCVRATRRISVRYGRCCHIEVYDSQSRDWKICVEEFSASAQVNFSSGVHFKNVIYWKNKLYFDIEKNVTGKLSGGLEAPFPRQLQESNDNLYYFIVVSEGGEKWIAVYGLKEDNSEWILKYHEGFGRRTPGWLCILSFIRGDGDEASTLVFLVSGKIMAYRLLDKSFKELVDLTNQPFFQGNGVQFDPGDIHVFGESLAPV